MRSFFSVVTVLSLIAGVSDAGPFKLRLFRAPACANGTCRAPEYIPASEPPAPTPIQPAAPGMLFDGEGSGARDDAADPQPEPVPSAQPKDLPKKEEEFFFGVDWSKIADHKVTYNGRHIDCKEAIERIQAVVPDDSRKLRVVCIGTREECEPVKKALGDAEQPLRDRIVGWFVTPDHWSLKDTLTGETRFKVDGHPTVYLLAPDGRSLHRQDGWTGAQDVEAIRKGLKAYDAARDADLRKTPLPDLKKKDAAKPDQGNTVPLGMLALGALAVVLVFFSRRQQQ